MKGLNKIALVAAIAAASTAQAELVAMDDASMGVTTGQAGLTIDVNAANISIGAVDYKDQGFISIKGINLTGADFATNANSTLDDIRLTVDVAGATADLGVPALGATYLSFAPGANIVGSAEVNQNALISDGDLVIALRSQTGTPVDFGLQIASVELGASTNAAGSVTGGTVLVSNLALAGALGPIDIVIDGSNGGMNINAYFNVQGQLTLPFVETSFALAIHDSRGAVQTSIAGGAVSFAHAQMNIGQATNAAGNTALAFDLQDFSGDIDMTNIQLGNNGASIGDLYMTDFRMSAQTIVYGH